MARLQLSGVTKCYGDFKAADNISLDIADGEFLVLLGPSGCGKTTTLRIVAGFIEPTSGRVRLGEQDITALPPWKRNAGLVFQSYALFPHMSEGRIRQIGSQQDLYERPAEKFVADFVGRSTFIDGRMDGPGRFVSAGGLAVACEGTATGSAALALRPERLALMTAAAPSMDNSFAGSVEFISYLGSQVDLHVRLWPQEPGMLQSSNQ